MDHAGPVSFFRSSFLPRMLVSHWRILIEEICVSENDCGCAWSMDIRGANPEIGRSIKKLALEEFQVRNDGDQK